VAVYASALSPVRVAAHYSASGRTVAPSYVNSVLTDAPVGYYRLAESSGTVDSDSSGYGKSGTDSGTLCRLAPGFSGRGDPASTFNGTTSVVNLGNPQTYPAGFSPRSLEVWCSVGTMDSFYRWCASYGFPGTGEAMFIGRQGTTLIAGGYMGDDLLVGNFWSA